MQFNEANHIAGPAIVTYDSLAWYARGGIDLDIPAELWNVVNSRYGTISKRIKSLPVGTVSFTPDGQVTTTHMIKAFPYTLADIGKSIFGAADKTLVIQTLAGKKYTFKKVGIIQSPGLHLAATAPAFDGTLQFMCIHATNSDVAVADNFCKVETSPYTDATFDETKIITPGYTAAYGAADYASMESLDGFKISLPISVSKKNVDRFGTIGAYLTGIGPATCAFTPAGMTEALWLALVNIDGAAIKLPGTDVSAGSTDLVISGTGLSVTLPKAGAFGGKLGFDTDKERIGEVVFHNRAVFAAGVPGSLLTIAVS